mgnify:CR=1 FL=1
MDPYKVLEIDKNASDTEIKKAYHKLARKHHPDRNKNDKQSEEKFKEINEAYFILMNGGSSNQAFGSDGFNPDIDSIFSKFKGMDFTKISQKLFNEARLFQKFFSEKHPNPNGCETEKLTMDDIVINARIDIRDIYYNLEKKFSIPRKVKCRGCMGLGTITNNILCSECNGSRYMDQKVDLKIANNNGASSSIFDFGLHTKIWPDVSYVKSIEVETCTLTSLIDNEKIDLKAYQALLIDTQGSELLVLKGASKILNKFKYIITEAADFESYIGGCKIEDLSKFLNNYGYKEVIKTQFAHNPKAGNYYDVIYERL